LRGEPDTVSFVSEFSSIVLILFLNVVILYCSWRLPLQGKGIKVKALKLMLKMLELRSCLLKLRRSPRATKLPRVSPAPDYSRCERVAQAFVMF
jgi:hypothetical protein